MLNAMILPVSACPSGFARRMPGAGPELVSPMVLGVDSSFGGALAVGH